MVYRIRKVKINDLLFYLSYTVFLLLSLMSTSFWFQYINGSINVVGKVFCIALLILRELNVKKKTRKSIYGLFVCVLISCLLFVIDTSQRNNYICLIFFVYAARNVDFKDIAKITLRESILFLIITILSSQLGIIQNYTALSGGRERQYLGFLYALVPPTIFLNILLLIFYLKRGKYKWTEILIYVAFSYWLYIKTVARLPFAFSICTILLMIVIRYQPNLMARRKNLRRILSFSFAIFAVISVVLLVSYSSGSIFASSVNYVMENRIALAYDAFSQYGISAFGQKFDMIGNGLNIYGENTSRLYLKYTYIDNLYLQLLLRYGVVFFTIFIVILTAVSYRISKIEEDGKLNFILFILSLQAMIQDCFLSINYNTFIFLVGIYLMTSIEKLAKNYKESRFQSSLLRQKGSATHGL